MRDPAAFAVWVGLPLVIGVLITTAFGGKEGPAPQAQVLVVDHDDSLLTGLLVGALSQDALGGLVHAEEVEETEGRRRIAKGDATALLVIPEGFASAVFREEKVALELVKNPSERFLPEIVEEILSIFVDTVFYAHRLIGDDLRTFAAGPPEGGTVFPNATISDFSVRVNELVESMSESLAPRAINLEIEEKPEDPELAGLAVSFAAGLLVMSLLFVAQGLSADLWREHEQKTLRRVFVSPQNVLDFLAGKLLCAVVLMLAVSTVALVIGFAYFELPWRRFPLAIVWCAFAGASFFSGMSLIQLLAGSQRASNILTTTLTFPLTMAGGSFFPFEIMPDWLAAIGRHTPNGWALEQLKAIVRGQAEMSPLLGAAGFLFAAGALLFLLSGLRLRTRFARA
jgi:ABC-2 type transport system permease protein